MERKLTIKGNMTQVEMEETLEKAVSSIQLKRENHIFNDRFLKDHKQQVDGYVKKTFDNMISEIADVLKRASS